MQAPRFWSNPPDAPGVLSTALLPLGHVWTSVTARRLAAGAWQMMPIPVICVGNLSVGGTGKTPTVAALLARLQDRGVGAGALYRGYKGSLVGPQAVDPFTHSSDQTGDEALLTAGFGPTWVARDRAAGIRAMAGAGIGVAVLDDGLQNPSVAKDLSIVVIDAEAGFGNGRVMPAGPLREPVESGLARADLLVTIGPTAAQARLARTWPQIADHPRLATRLEPLATGMTWSGLRCLAFAGIGRPEKFFASLRAAGADIVATRSFADHAAYPRPMLQRLLAEAKRHGAQLVTTEKDAVRLPADIRPQVMAFPVRLEARDWSPLDAALDRLL